MVRSPPAPAPRRADWPPTPERGTPAANREFFPPGSGVTEDDLPDGLVRFIRSTLPSYEATVLLVHIAREPARAWAMEELVAHMGPAFVSLEAARRHADHFERCGLVKRLARDRYRYAPRTDELRARVDELLDCYQHRPVTLVRVAYAAANARIRSFSDAFRIRRE